MPARRLVGLVLLIGGLALLWFAHQRSETFGDQMKHFFTGDYRDQTTQMIVAGGIATLLGMVALVTSNNPRPKG